MTDLPTKDEIVERAHRQTALSTSRASVARALDALTVPDLLALLRERGADVQPVGGAGLVSAIIRMPREEKPDD